MLNWELGNARKGHLAVAAQSARKKDDSMRASRLLIIIAILTLLSDFPQGLETLLICHFLPVISCFYSYYSATLWACIQVCTTSCNLVITLAMSRNFREVS
ncbi:hypothetical protein PMAYCL1PPCAC_21424, partial [Pristionchus mayeri]